jgi:hypothetical protein
MIVILIKMVGLHGGDRCTWSSSPRLAPLTHDDNNRN